MSPVRVLLLHLAVLLIRTDASLKDEIEGDSAFMCPKKLCLAHFSGYGGALKFCSCSSDCAISRDCCDENGEENGLPNDLQNKEPECICAVHTASLGSSMPVSSCPTKSTYSLNATQVNWRLCTGRSKDQTHMLDIPVTSADTGVTYKNVYCAVCHEDALNLLPLRALLKGNSGMDVRMVMSDANYHDGELYWAQDSTPNGHSDTLSTPLEEDSRTIEEIIEAEGTLRYSPTSGELISWPDQNTINVMGWDGVQTLFTDEEGSGMDSANVEDMWNKTENVIAGYFGSEMNATKKTLKKQKVHENSRNESLVKLPSPFIDSLMMMDKSNTKRNDFDSGRLVAQLLIGFKPIRLCPNGGNFLDSCNNNQSRDNEDISKQCESCFVPIYPKKMVHFSDSQVLKKHYCPYCNDSNEMDSKCRDLDASTSPASLLMDEILGAIDIYFGDVLKGHEKCGPRSLWDPLFERCYYLETTEISEQHATVTTPEMNTVESTVVVKTLRKQAPATQIASQGDENDCGNITLMTMSNIQWYLASVFFTLSIGCLGLHIILQSYKSSSDNDDSSIARHSSCVSLERAQIISRSFTTLSWLLAIGQLLFITGIHRTEIRTVCVAIAVLHNFVSLAAISWLSVCCLQVFKSYFSVNTFKTMGSFGVDSEAPSLRLTLIAWIIPTVFACLCLTLELVPGSFRSCLARGGACWYGDTVSFRIFFVLPALLMLAGDGCIFTAIIFGIREKKENKAITSLRRKNNSHMRRRRSSVIPCYDHRRFRLCTRLGIIIATSWSCAIAASLGGFPSLWYGFVIFSGVQGVFIFVSSGSKSKLTSLIWVKVKGQSVDIGQEGKSRRKNLSTVNNAMSSVNVQK